MCQHTYKKTKTTRARARARTHTHTHTHTCMHACMQTYMHTRMRTCRHTCMHAYTINTCMHACVQCIRMPATCAMARDSSRKRTRMRARTHTHLYFCINIRTHPAHTSSRSSGTARPDNARLVDRGGRRLGIVRSGSAEAPANTDTSSSPLLSLIFFLLRQAGVEILATSVSLPPFSLHSPCLFPFRGRGLFNGRGRRQK